MKHSRQKRLQTVGLVTGALAAVWCLWYFLYTRFGIELLHCPVHSLTGLYCPGCGTMRAIVALLQLQPHQAIRYNVLTTLTLPFLALYLALHILSYIRRGHGLAPGRFDKWIAIGYIVLAVAFGIMRNLPWFAFLAPTGIL
ncbi:DUF2752 domain-containing protein [Ruminococcaceae bacterium OttesenSCG-928-L11]|nr:DUF2752 domain-containing protein [Ruminococcaceae bacterium OttesenSCG-928-L11]